MATEEGQQEGTWHSTRFGRVWSRSRWFIALGLLVGVVCGLFDLAVVRPDHAVTGEVLLGSPTLGGSTAGRDTGHELTGELPTIALLATSDGALREVLASTHLREDVAQLRSQVRVSPISQTLLLDVRASLPTFSESVSVVDTLITELPGELQKLGHRAGTSATTVTTLVAPEPSGRGRRVAATLGLALLLGALAGLLVPVIVEAFRTGGADPPAVGRRHARTTILVSAVAASSLLIPLGLGLPLIALAGLVMLAIAVSDPWYGLLVTVAAIVLLPAPFSVGVGHATITVGRVLLFALLIGWFAQLRWSERRILPRHTAFDRPLLLLLAAILASLVVNLPVLRGYELLGGLRAFALFAIDFSLLFAVTVSVLRSRDRRLRLLRFVGGLIGFTSALGMVELATGKDVFQYLDPVLPRRIAQQINGLSQAAVLTRGGFHRLHATFEQPLVFASALLLGLPIAVALAMTERTGKRRLAWTLIAILDGVALLFTASRGAYILGGLTLVTFLVLGPRGGGRRTVLVTVAAVAVIFLAVPGLRATMSHYFHFNQNGQVEGSIKSRLQGAHETLPLVYNKPLFGYGAHTFSTGELAQNQLIPPGGKTVLDDAYLLQAAETGILGLMALAAVLIYGWTSSWRTYRSATAVQEKALGLAMVASVQSWIGMGFIADLYVFNAPPKLFFVLLAVAAVSPTAAEPESEPERELLGESAPA